jgi:glycosyltransferase involved in cell wall biosynthesis
MSDEPEKSVLIITYYWPPSGGSGVQRWLKFVKYLPTFGYTPYVFTPENPAFETKDESLLKDVPAEAEVLHFPIWEPYNLFNKLAGKNPEHKNAALPKPDTWFKKLSIWIRGNIFIPDPRIFWVRPSVNFLHDFIREKKIRTIITTGPPHSIHLIGKSLKKRNPSLKWIADFRDPWSEWYLLDSLKVSRIARRVHQYLERKVLTSADRVTTVTPFYVRHFQRLGNRTVTLLTNGYDEEDFQNFTPQPTEKFVIRHVGRVVEECDPLPFMETVAALCKLNSAFQHAILIDFVGQVNEPFKEYIRQHQVLQSVVTFTPAVSHKEVISLYAQSNVLLLILSGYKDAEGYMPGKLFEYCATGLPILGVGPEAGDAAQLINKLKYGVMVSEKESKKIEMAIMQYFNAWSSGSTQDNTHKDQYSRKAITKQLTELLA